MYLELSSPYEQAQLFNKAKIIVGPHGSGFANLIFAAPKCKVVEIDHGTTPTRSFYKRMANYMSCDYYPFYVNQITEEHLEDIARP
ncbi:MAG: glycosyltransferase 61 family protein [Rickettsia endosymbiont of Ixodes persulcatus]|nr:glycosyltransferase 61 family protein [Rickettsia endosymbiont of Ixodes persulcatus]MCZ6914070.1 glycosyltransferase 61 family protein [Rickettsia endosymbiont of Ixodes persulcatus]MCZ6919096.1 glycosyltransferase 61 family protein [Rickettsia endosymbiont of Ixodes persulcatus]MCZ6923975.1 glycosyltransferase 61 family protein [Rickettsia endosymbiont of Ixodes persulcatus]